MTSNKKLIDGTLLGSSASTLYTATNVSALTKKVTVCNTSASAITVTIYFVPSAGTAGNANVIVDAQSVGAGQTQEFYVAENHVLASGDSIQAFASTANAGSLRVSGIEIS